MAPLARTSDNVTWITTNPPRKRDCRLPVVRLLEDLNLGISCYPPDLSTVNPVMAGNRQRYLDLFRRNVDMCVDLGSPRLRVDTTAAPGSIEDSDREAAMERVADLWHQAADIAQEAAVQVVWEFEPGFSFNKPSEIVDLHERVGHPNFRILVDTSHAYTCSVVGARQHGQKETLKGGVAGLLKKLEGRIGHVHIIDTDGTLYGDETSTHRPFGKGKIDFDALTPQLLKTPNIEWWCVDHCFWAGSWDLVGESLAFVRGLLARHSN